MTIICVDHHSVATDGLQVCDGIITSRTTEKLRVVKNTIYAMTGTRLFWGPLIEWHQAGADVTSAPKGDKDNSWTLVVVNREGVWQFCWDTPLPDRFEPPWAWGANYGTALGLMLAGKTAAESVGVMCERSVWAGGDIQVVNIADALGLQPVREAACIPNLEAAE